MTCSDTLSKFREQIVQSLLRTARRRKPVNFLAAPQSLPHGSELFKVIGPFLAMLDKFLIAGLYPIASIRSGLNG